MRQSMSNIGASRSGSSKAHHKEGPRTGCGCLWLGDPGLQRGASTRSLGGLFGSHGCSEEHKM
jgi:hypothetical protein